MALTNGNTDTTMLVTPANMAYGYGGGGNNGLFGNGDSWLGILFLIALCNGGFGGFGGFGGGYGAMMGMGMMDGFGLYPWLNNSEHISDGFRDQQLSTQVGNIQNSITSGFGDVQNALCNGFGNVQTSLCSGFAGVNASINGAQNALAQQMYSNQIADLERSFAAQTANTQGLTNLSSQLATCCCENRAATSDLKYVIAQENCADRYEAAQNTRDIIDSQTRSTQAILDKLCALELDGVKSQLAQAQRENVGLQNQINMANLATSQTAQTSDIINGVYTRLSQCPVGSTPVYGNTPIFQCPINVADNNGGCGCNGRTF